MDSESNKELVREFLLQGFGEGDLDVVDRIFAPHHILRSPAIGNEAVEGTEFIKGAIEEFWSGGGEVLCRIGDQVAEGARVATSYSLSEDRGDHEGIMINYFAEGRIEQSLVVARDVSGSITEDQARRKVFN